METTWRDRSEVERKRLLEKVASNSLCLMWYSVPAWILAGAGIGRIFGWPAYPHADSILEILVWFGWFLWGGLGLRLLLRYERIADDMSILIENLISLIPDDE